MKILWTSGLLIDTEVDYMFVWRLSNWGGSNLEITDIKIKRKALHMNELISSDSVSTNLIILLSKTNAIKICMNS